MNQGTNMPITARVAVPEFTPEAPNGLKIIGEGGISVVEDTRNMGTVDAPDMKEVLVVSADQSGAIARMKFFPHKFVGSLKLDNQIPAEKLLCSLDTTGFAPEQYPYINLELPDLHADDHGKEVILFLSSTGGVNVNAVLPQPIAGRQEFLLSGLGSSMRFTCVSASDVPAEHQGWYLA